MKIHFALTKLRNGPCGGIHYEYVTTAEILAPRFALFKEDWQAGRPEPLVSWPASKELVVGGTLE